MTLKQIAKAIGENSEAIHQGTITWEAFDKRNKELWRMADRNELCTVGSNCARRTKTVMDELRTIGAIR